jgi:hypothetical protein
MRVLLLPGRLAQRSTPQAPPLVYPVIQPGDRVPRREHQEGGPEGEEGTGE